MFILCDAPTERRPGIRDPEAAAAHDNRDWREGGEGAGARAEARYLLVLSCLVVAIAVAVAMTKFSSICFVVDPHALVIVIHMLLL